MTKVDALLEEIQTDYERTNNFNVKPVTRVFNAAINAHLKNLGGLSQKARDASHTGGWACANKVHSILNALNRKWKETGDESFHPDITTYTMVIDAYGRCNDIAALEKGESLFNKVYKEWKETGDDKLKPSSRTFTVVSVCNMLFHIFKNQLAFTKTSFFHYIDGEFLGKNLGPKVYEKG
jgi:hypothetical protein